MARKARKLDVACQNSKCKCFNKFGLLNVIRHGSQKNKVQRYMCTECGKTFGRTKNTPFFHKHLKKKEIINICKMLSEKITFRGIARVTGHHLDTIRAIADAIAKHCKQFNNFFLVELKLTPIEVDEMWNFVKKKKKIA